MLAKVMIGVCRIVLVLVALAALGLLVEVAGRYGMSFVDGLCVWMLSVLSALSARHALWD
ncbi:hypothetical protein [Roseospira navarrensis]|uniref:Uncharacterized protein n=1 Tax=Roseospira navarrensis TaxID=140058 RepID=A0A7X1ZFW8_9PROT|nr:hypothetical protein [Roseospira navarrensis]MQX36841.1 hypothetical protein [Roseospira navarrensis]